MFIGRKKEKEILKKAIEKPGHCVIVYGNRRVGKTTLINETMKESDNLFVSFECLKSSMKNNINGLIKLLKEMGISNFYPECDDFIDLFKFINSLNMHIVVLIDEYPYLYLKNDKDYIDSMFQTIVDKYSDNINIIFSGSHIGMMKDLLKHSNPLFGRMFQIIHLKELDYLEASEFYPNLSNHDKVMFYSVFGGSPYILKQLSPSKGIEENIYNTFLNTESAVYMFLSEGYTTDISSKDNANQIFEAIGNSKVRHNRLEDLLGFEHNGLLSKRLASLTEMDFIGKNVPINKLDDKKKFTYYIKNNALRFYYTYVYGNTNFIQVIGYKTFFERYIKDSLTTFISYAFENIVKDYLSILVKNGLLKDAYNIGSYYYDDPINKKNGEFDVAIKLKNGYDIIEVKFLKNKLAENVIKEEIYQIKQIKELEVKGYGFASINGFNKDSYPDVKYLISGDNIYFKKTA